MSGVVDGLVGGNADGRVASSIGVMPMPPVR